MPEMQKYGVQEGNYINQKIRKGDDILWEDIDEETVVFDLRNKNTYSLNQMASIIWLMCDGQHTSSEICDVISEEVLTVSSAQVLTDVLKIVADLINKGLVEMT